MKKNPALFWLSALVVILAIIVTAAGVFWPREGGPASFTSIHGREVELYGQGLYRNDSAFRAPVLIGTDTVTLFVFVPLLALCLFFYRRGSLRAGLLLAGMLAYFLYNAAALALGVAYNPMFLVYIVYFSACLYAFITALTSVDVQALAETVSPRLPYRGMGIFLFFAGLSVFVWLIEIVGGLMGGTVPEGLAHYTTDTTAALDIGIIAPSAYFAGVLMLRRKPLGLLLGFVLTVLNAMVGLMVILQTALQIINRVSLTGGQMIAYVAPFVVLASFASAFIIRYLRCLSTPATRPAAQHNRCLTA